MTEKNAKEFDVLFPAPLRSVPALANVSGHFVAIMPSKSLRFTFATPSQGANQISDGVELTITELKSEKDWWTVALTIEVPAAGPRFDSFQAWLGSGAWLDRCNLRLERGAGENTQTIRPEALYTQAFATSSPTRGVFASKSRLAKAQANWRPGVWRATCQGDWWR